MCQIVTPEGLKKWVIKIGSHLLVSVHNGRSTMLTCRPTGRAGFIFAPPPPPPPLVIAPPSQISRPLLFPTISPYLIPTCFHLWPSTPFVVYRNGRHADGIKKKAPLWFPLETLQHYKLNLYSFATRIFSSLFSVQSICFMRSHTDIYLIISFLRTWLSAKTIYIIYVVY